MSKMCSFHMFKKYLFNSTTTRRPPYKILDLLLLELGAVFIVCCWTKNKIKLKGKKHSRFYFEGTVYSRVLYTTAHNNTKFVGVQLITKCYLALQLLFMANKMKVNIHSTPPSIRRSYQLWYHYQLCVFHFYLGFVKWLYSMIKLYFTISSEHPYSLPIFLELNDHLKKYRFGKYESTTFNRCLVIVSPVSSQGFFKILHKQLLFKIEKWVFTDLTELYILHFRELPFTYQRVIMGHPKGRGGGLLDIFLYRGGGGLCSKEQPLTL